jgi:hypothetical protein
MALTPAEKQRRYRDRKKVTRVTETEQSVTEPSVTVAECDGIVDRAKLQAAASEHLEVRQ